MTTYTGTNGDDTITGASADDFIFGLDGNDVLSGGLGNDEINGGRGDDSLFGGEGDDILRGHSGDDYLSGGNGNDKLYGTKGENVLSGGNGDDFIWLGADDSADRVVISDPTGGSQYDRVYQFNTEDGDVIDFVHPGTVTMTDAVQKQNGTMIHYEEQGVSHKLWLGSVDFDDLTTNDFNGISGVEQFFDIA